VKVGYKNICEIGKERIRRAGDKIKDEAGLTAKTLMSVSASSSWTIPT
jgi:adenine-specific DNA-methyltransferase